MKKLSIITSALIAGQLSAASVGAEEVSKAEFEALKQELQSLNEKLEMTAEMIDQSSSGDSAMSRTSIGGYGEMHYNNLSNQKSGGEDKKEIDLHRAILFIGHEYNNKIRFWSELEVEHSKVDKSGGEVAMEQAYIEIDVHENASVKTGIFLVPAGIINETHEPNTFYGVERNPVEKNIIPTTWREGGVAVSGRITPAVAYDVAVHSGLAASTDSSYKVRSGRKNVRQAPANDLAYTGRIKWTGVPGLELAATLQYQSDVTQSIDADAGSAILTEAHAVFNKGPYGMRALYAMWSLDGDGPKAKGADEQSGWYIEPSYRISPEWGVFARYNSWDNAAGNSADSEYVQVDAGVNYWPHPNVVFKADYQRQATPDGENNYDGFNLGVGYQF